LIEKPLVSIITPVYNSGKYIAATIESIIDQSYQNWELLITDDGSIDDSVRTVEYYSKKDNRIKLFRLHENSGAAIARNNSIKMAKGRFIAFCDSDDIWLPEKLEKQISFMMDNSYIVTFASYICMDEYGNYKYTIRCKKRINYSSLLRDNGIGCLTATYDTSILGKQYMPIMLNREDWGLWLSIVKKVTYIHGMDEVLAIYRDRENSLSSRKMDMLKYNYQIYRQVEKFSPIVSVFFLFFVFLPYYLYKKSSRYLYQYHDIDKAVFGDIAKLIKKNLTTEEGYKLQRETMFLDIPYSKMILTLQS
jgi:glycosyltransferase involved in cell wall biosynthesis